MQYLSEGIHTNLIRVGTRIGIKAWLTDESPECSGAVQESQGLSVITIERKAQGAPSLARPRPSDTQRITNSHPSGSLGTTTKSTTWTSRLGVEGARGGLRSYIGHGWDSSTSCSTPGSAHECPGNERRHPTCN